MPFRQELLLCGTVVPWSSMCCYVCMDSAPFISPMRLAASDVPTFP
jgi:hypothetical protein